jgi:hypothetical protein
MPSPQKPVARWHSLRTRSRTVLDLGRRMVEQRAGSAPSCIGQLYMAALVLDPLELTLIGQGLLELPQGRAGGRPGASPHLPVNRCMDPSVVSVDLFLC